MIHLTGQNYNVREIIQNVFSPLVGVISSPQADDLCHKNNLSFVEMLQPFCKLSNDAHFRDPAGTGVSVKGLRLNICDIGWRPPQTMLARKMLTEAVSTGSNDKTKVIFVNNGTKQLEIPTFEPWFEQWRETFLTVQFPTDHEFTRHFLSCLIVLSSSDQNILETANQLTKKIQMLQNVTPQKLPKWFSFDVLNCYVILHDGCHADISKAQQSYEQLKSSYGENRCFLIQINSVSGTNQLDCPDPWIRYIKRQPKSDISSEQGSAPKTPQDSSGVSSMPSSVQLSNLESPSSEVETTFLHPLSPVQEQATEAIHSKFSTSSESINSQPTINPNVWASELEVDVPHGMWLSSSDVENLRHFVQDFNVRALLPFVEKLVMSLNDSITNKKGVSRSLLSATKRWFVANKPGVGSNIQNAVIYTAESTELQTRKLGDLYFMFGNYNLAFQAYHQAKRDFNSDSAWQYYAGALEMAALSAFMLGTVNRKTYDYMEDAIVTYLNVCKLPQFATRATILSIECLKSAKLYGEAAKQLIRMTSEDSDLRSALLLEQAAYCFLMSQPAMHRKYSFHIVLSGNRYSRAGQRKHAFRCYKQAYQVFEGCGWGLAEDHIQYTIGKQAVTLKRLDVACHCLAYLLRSTSQQNVTQQATFLRDYIATLKELINQNPGIGPIQISLPKIIQNSIRVLCTSHPPAINDNLVPASNISVDTDLKDESKWQKVEEMIVQSASLRPIVFKSSRCLFTSENLTPDSPLSVHGEPIEIALALSNTIKPNISLTDISLLWEFIQENGEKFSNINLFEGQVSLEEKEFLNGAVLVNNIPEVELAEQEEKIIQIQLTPKLIGKLRLTGIRGKMSAGHETGSLYGCINFEPLIIRSFDKASSSSSDKSVQFDNKLNIEILPPAPSLNVCFSPIPVDVLCGEVIPVTMNLLNSGAAPLDNIYIGCENPRWITIADLHGELPLSILKDYKDLTNEALSRDKETRKQHVYKIPINSDNLSLNPQESMEISMWIQAPYEKGEFKLRILIYYGMPPTYPKLKYRLVRHEWIFNVQDSLQTECCCVIGNLVNNELGLDISIKNLNQTHHPLSTEISLCSITQFCSAFKLLKDKTIFLNETELQKGQVDGMKNIDGKYELYFDQKHNSLSFTEKCIKAGRSLSFRCNLIETKIDKVLTPLEYIKIRLSSIEYNSNTSNIRLPSLENFSNFLIKNETKFFNNLTNEEFNNIVSSTDQHMTVAINWKALVIDQLCGQRLAFGQHFLQLKNLYEQISCPETADYRMKTYLGDHPTYYKIYNFKNTIPKLDSDDDDQWEPNNNFVGIRCLLEDEDFEVGKSPIND